MNQAPFTPAVARDVKSSNARHRWAVVIPFYNEEDFLGATLQSLGRQIGADVSLVLVDNNSSDDSLNAVHEFKRRHPDIPLTVLSEKTPGKAAAMKKGLAAVDADFTALADADTYYPPHYLSEAERLLAKDGTVAAFAFGLSARTGVKHKVGRAKGVIVSAMLSKQCHTGGYGQTFRSSVLNEIGGLDPALWPYCLMDHELAHRAAKAGNIAYGGNFWCVTSGRRADRSSVRWTLSERLLYHVVPHRFKDWFFYQYLGPRFKKRGLTQLNLRERSWESV
ncbi:MAG: glycosyltransferase family A protein [Pseudomonadota bacterium]